jgi:hypothetical protein
MISLTITQAAFIRYEGTVLWVNNSSFSNELRLYLWPCMIDIQFVLAKSQHSHAENQYAGKTNMYSIYRLLLAAYAAPYYGLQSLRTSDGTPRSTRRTIQAWTCKALFQSLGSVVLAHLYSKYKTNELN